MMEYISKQIAVEELENLRQKYEMHDDCDELVARKCKNAVSALPAANVAPVVHARWVRIYESGEPAIEQFKVGVCCSKCMKMPEDKFTESDYCPHCGAKMDG